MKKALFWKFLERFGVLGIQFILQVILARLLDPDHYGSLSLMTVFTHLATIFIQYGFNTALVQNKDVTDEDYSSVLWVSLLVAAIVYAVMYAAAPFIAAFYEIPDLIQPFRILCLMLLPGALNSIQLAKVSREMDFKEIFRSNVVAIIVSGSISVGLALAGAGLWALVAQSLINVIVACITMWTTVHWRPQLVCNFARVRVLFSFGWKLLVSGLLDTLYQNIQSLVIGKKYDTGMLGYYSRGHQFPQFIISAINSSIQSVLLPAMSAQQDDKQKIKILMRNAVMVSSYVIFPMMAGLVGVAAPLVSLLLTDKWLPCVPFLQIGCFSLTFYPIHTSNLQAINAMGRSDIFLKLEIIKKSIGLGILVIAVFCFDSPIAISVSGAIGAVISSFINAWPNKKLIGYSYFEQIKDILPSFVASMVMCVIVLLIQQLNMAPLLTLVVQVVTGVVTYVAISAAAKMEPYEFLLGMLKELLFKKRETGEQ